MWRSLDFNVEATNAAWMGPMDPQQREWQRRNPHLKLLKSSSSSSISTSLVMGEKKRTRDSECETREAPRGCLSITEVTETVVGTALSTRQETKSPRSLPPPPPSETHAVGLSTIKAAEEEFSRLFGKSSSSTCAHRRIRGSSAAPSGSCPALFPASESATRLPERTTSVGGVRKRKATSHVEEKKDDTRHLVLRVEEIKESKEEKYSPLLPAPPSISDTAAPQKEEEDRWCKKRNGTKRQRHEAVCDLVVPSCR